VLTFLDQRKQATMQRLQDANQSKSNVNNLNNVKCEASRHFRNKKKEYLKAKINLKLTVRQKNIRDLYRDINDFKKGCQPKTNIVRDDKGDLVRLPQYFGYVKETFLSAVHCLSCLVYMGLTTSA
jgi:phage-related tail protein